MRSVVFLPVVLAIALLKTVLAIPLIYIICYNQMTYYVIAKSVKEGRMASFR
ncbi:hypothetical protein DA73_0400024255 [Tolypothrix bouteillei VB521301]|uniref:Uncharacterized protein n=1 Tax=Tolypothrix bouteillei VB521301 TaxID=1479485 RepID=A0A8S9T769_9CYAN|nr:hypothetical protein DA73_0400024255 [Tolypothrix bouteillei VB521301]